MKYPNISFHYNIRMKGINNMTKGSGREVGGGFRNALKEDVVTDLLIMNSR